MHPDLLGPEAGRSMSSRGTILPVARRWMGDLGRPEPGLLRRAPRPGFIDQSSGRGSDRNAARPASELFKFPDFKASTEDR